MSAERWAPVLGYEGLYEVSDLGRVRSLDRVIVNSRGQHRQYAGRVLKPQTDPDGYHYVSLHRSGAESRAGIHSLMLRAFVGPPPDGMQCRHLNGDSGDNRLDNLRWGTPKEDGEDRIRHGKIHGIRKQVCPKCGGEYKTLPSGRYCRSCRKEYLRRQYLERKQKE